MQQLDLFPVKRVRLQFPLYGEDNREGTLVRKSGGYYYVLLDCNNEEMELYRNEFEFLTEEEN